MPRARQKPARPKIQDDRKLSLTRIEQKAGKSIVEQLLQVQNYLNPKPRSLEWTHHLTCLRAIPTPERSSFYQEKSSLKEVRVDIFQGNFKYAAVSYCCKPNKSENPEKRKYQIFSRGSHNPRLQRVRDTVLDRVVAFVSDHSLDGFWIDDECLDKHDKEKEQEVIDGMDVVYRKCDQAVGLLSKSIRSWQQLDLLTVLLSQKFVELLSKNGKVELARGVSLEKLHGLMRVLKLIFSDRWWTRCWIFQEAYFGQQMLLLIPCTVPVSYGPKSRYVRRLGTDVELSLRQLQSQTTLICLAICQASSARVRSLRPQAQKLLKSARRYDVLHNYRDRAGEKLRNVPMSASIITDVCARGLKRKSDIPAIIANCCDYTRRIDLQSDADQFSLSVVVLALFLLNGDMLTPLAKSRAELSRTVCELLTRSSFSQSIMPTTSKELTFLKRRRWPEVELTPEGLVTRGHIWTLDRTVTLKRKPYSHHFDRWSGTQALKPFERARLRQLAALLTPNHPDLSSTILDWLNQTSGQHGLNTQRNNIMCLMAKKVCQTMKKGRPLWLGKSLNMSTYHGVFVYPEREPNHCIHAVTSWQAGRCIETTTDLREVEKYVSLEVEIDACNGKTNQQCVPRGWINGLSFFFGLPSQSIHLPWQTCLNG